MSIVQKEYFLSFLVFVHYCIVWFHQP